MSECHSYLSLFFQSKNILLMAKMLIKPFLVPFVHGALLALNTTSALGLDVIPCSVYAVFAKQLSPAWYRLLQGYYS